MKLLPILEDLKSNTIVGDHPECQEIVEMTVGFYKRIGFNPPWIGYLALLDNDLVGTAGFKGQPKNGMVEISYGVFPKFERKGIGTQICGQIVKLALLNDSQIKITARTLPQDNASCSILKKNQFEFVGTIWDEEDGNVWEWEYKG